MFHIRKEIRIYTALLILIVLGFWQVSFFVYGLKWDLIDVVLPFRYFFSESFRSGHFPFWNPYQQTGTPFFADLQAPTYYPELPVISLLGGYGIYTMHILLILYLFVAAYGMFRLSYHFNKSNNASLFASLAYVFSGYIVGHGQHFFLLVGAAWMPYVILSYIKLNQERRAIYALKSAIFVFLLLTGAYQALSITMLYLMLLIFLYFLIRSFVKENPKNILQLIKVNFLFSLLVVLLTLPLFASTLEIFFEVDRLEHGVDLKKSLEFGQPFSTLISFIIPFSTLKYNDFFGSIDASLINHYIGVISLPFLLLSFFRKHSVLEYLILVFGLLIFSMSFDFLSVRELMYKFVPFMDLFLSAAYIRVFGILPLILISAGYFAYFEKRIASERKSIIISSSFFLIVFLIIIIYSAEKLSSTGFKSHLNINNTEGFLNNLSFHQHLIIQSIIHFIVVSGLVLIVIFHNRVRYPAIYIILLFSIELILATQLNMNATVIDMKHKPVNMQKDLSLCPQGFPVPVNSKISFNDQQHAYYPPFWRNTYIFTKQVSFDAFSSFRLGTYRKLEEEYPKLKNMVINNHLFYFSDAIFPFRMLSDSIIDVQKTTKHLYLSDQDYDVLVGREVKTNSSDIIEIQEFTPNRVIIKTKTKNDQFLTVLQTNYIGWHAFVDDNPAPIYTSNINYRTIYLPQGEHIVKYEYKNKKVLSYYIFSNLFFVACVLFLIGYWLYHKNTGGKTFIIIPLVLASLILLLLINGISTEKDHRTNRQYYDTRWQKENAYMHLVKEFEEEKNNCDSTIYFKEKNGCRIQYDTEFLSIAEILQKDKILKKGILAITAEIYTNTYSKAFLVSEINKEWHAVKIEKQIEELNKWNEIRYYRNMPRLKEGEIVKVYLWNPNGSEFIVRDITVNLYK